MQHAKEPASLLARLFFVCCICLKKYIIFETKRGGDLLQKDSIITRIYERIKEVGHDEVYIIGAFTIEFKHRNNREISAVTCNNLILRHVGGK